MQHYTLNVAAPTVHRTDHTANPQHTGVDPVGPGIAPAVDMVTRQTQPTSWSTLCDTLPGLPPPGKTPRVTTGTTQLPTCPGSLATPSEPQLRQAFDKALDRRIEQLDQLQTFMGELQHKLGSAPDQQRAYEVFTAQLSTLKEKVYFLPDVNDVVVLSAIVGGATGGVGLSLFSLAFGAAGFVQSLRAISDSMRDSRSLHAVQLRIGVHLESVKTLKAGLESIKAMPCKTLQERLVALQSYENNLQASKREQQFVTTVPGFLQSVGTTAIALNAINGLAPFMGAGLATATAAVVPGAFGLYGGLFTAKNAKEAHRLLRTRSLDLDKLAPGVSQLHAKTVNKTLHQARLYYLANVALWGSFTVAMGILLGLVLGGILTPAAAVLPLILIGIALAGGTTLSKVCGAKFGKHNADNKPHLMRRIRTLDEGDGVHSRNVELCDREFLGSPASRSRLGDLVRQQQTGFATLQRDILKILDEAGGHKKAQYRWLWQPLSHMPFLQGKALEHLDTWINHSDDATQAKIHARVLASIQENTQQELEYQSQRFAEMSGELAQLTQQVLQEADRLEPKAFQAAYDLLVRTHLQLDVERDKLGGLMTLRDELARLHAAQARPGDPAWRHALFHWLFKQGDLMALMSPRDVRDEPGLFVTQYRRSHFSGRQKLDNVRARPELLGARGESLARRKLDGHLAAALFGSRPQTLKYEERAITDMELAGQRA